MSSHKAGYDRIGFIMGGVTVVCQLDEGTGVSLAGCPVLICLQLHDSKEACMLE